MKASGRGRQKRVAAALKNPQHTALLERQLDAVLCLAGKYGSTNRNDNPNIVISLAYTRFALWIKPSIRKLDCQQAHCLFTGGSNEIIDIFSDHMLHTQRKKLPFISPQSQVHKE